jgi:hypothetical protein
MWALLTSSSSSSPPPLSTDGIQISSWAVEGEGEGEGEREDITFSVWDFAGQEVYYWYDLLELDVSVLLVFSHSSFSSLCFFLHELSFRHLSSARISSFSRDEPSISSFGISDFLS